MTDQPIRRPEPHDDEPGVHRFEIDIGMYLPEGVELADDSAATATNPAADADADSEGVQPADADPGVEPDRGRVDTDEVDTRLLEQIEGELDEVDAALRAIDAGDDRSSPLLRRLLADEDT